MSNQSQNTKSTRAATLWVLALIGVGVVGYLTQARWSPSVDALVASFRAAPISALEHERHDDHSAHGHDDHGHEDHGHEDHGHEDHGHEDHGHDDHGHDDHGHDDHGHDDHGHDDHGDEAMEDALTLTALQQRNLGLEIGIVKASDFEKHTVVQAIVVDRPGRSKIQIAAHAAGIVTDVFPLERQVVETGMPLIKMRLIHEDVIGLQTDLLAALTKVEIVERELKRLEAIGPEIIPGKRLIEKRNQRESANQLLRSITQSLRLHGFDEEEIESLRSKRQLIKEETIVVPETVSTPFDAETATQYHVQSIDVNRGQSVELGQSMMTLVDYSRLYVKGMAFEDDARLLTRCAREGRKISVVVDNQQSDDESVIELKVESVADSIDAETRALAFYLELPNESAFPKTYSSAALLGQSSNVPEFVSWKFRPGQRMQVRVPSNVDGQSLKNKIVLPTSAVVIDGPNAFVFEQASDVFRRLEVEVLYRDNQQVVLEYDRALIDAPIAIKGAYRMHLALKNEGGGGFDPHEGHSH